MTNKQSFIDKIAIMLLLVVFGGIILHTPLSVWASSNWPDYTLLIKSWKEILLLVVGVLVLIELIRKNQWKKFAKDRILQIIAVLGLLDIIITLAVNNPPISEAAGLMIGLRYYLFFGLLYVYVKRFPKLRDVFIKVFIAGAAVVSVFSMLQVTVLPKDALSHIGYSEQTIKPYLTVDLNQDYVRINSTMRGPNPLGAYAVIVVSFIGALWVRKKWPSRRLLQAGLGVIALGMVVSLWFSYSRSAMGALVVVAAVLAMSMGVKWLSKRAILMLVSIALIVGCIGLYIATTQKEMVANVIFHTNIEGGSEIKSDDARMSSLERGIEGISKQPLGYGIGSSGSASLLGDEPNIIENQYIGEAWQSGWLGLALTVWLYVVVMMRLYKQRKDYLSLAVFASGLGMAIIGIVLPVWTDDIVSIIWWGLAAVALAAGPVITRKRKAKTRL